MAVNLNGIELNGAATAAPRKAPAPQNGTSAPQDTAPQAGDVSITSTASLLAQLEQSLGAQPAINQKRVAALSEAIAAGRYKVQADKVASGLIHSERALARLPLAEI